MRKKCNTIILALVTLATCASLAFGQPTPQPAATVDVDAITSVNTGNIISRGWRFYADENMTVTHLGVFARKLDGSAGLEYEHQVGLWQLPSTGGFVDLTGVVTVGPASGGLEDNHVYVELAESVELVAGERYLLGRWDPGFPYGPENTDVLLLEPASAAEFNTAMHLDPAGGYTEDKEATGGLAEPWGRTITAHVGVNFKFTTAQANQPPVANDDTAETELATPVTINVLANDLDPDGDPLSIDSVSAPTNGTATKNADNTVTYTPNVNFVGMDTFSYTISDGNGGMDTAMVTVTVGPGTLEIDIKPGSYPNSINLGSHGVIPVAILSSGDFDATALDADKIFLAGSGVRVRGKGNNYLASEQDVDGDGLMDLVVKVETENLDPGTFQDGGAFLRVHEASDQASPVLYEGWDEINIVPPA